ncbi:histidinol-phosphatase (PHP family) [Desulfonispora thiosulfatigenes DSM 11270]|uniref:Histidinol-phosphatase n=1 Tax=Desulfonispora thiosulfatigenes DSM 11270 TaxID=656914 RepID=A0A1W1V8P7_DESTI|nr:histidinol-phosphatase HisJ family protein [Desulfonispora thiosulfatigenes]SMB89728.1 histidinol-phosphatase (PHP family) [Desulfonispora thiosulfatigenes DSM 11270]
MFNYLVDYHVHTHNSFDSTETMLGHCERAVEMGLKEIVFTEHFDLNPYDEGLGHFNYEKYAKEIGECREVYGDKILIKKGLELGEPHLYKTRHEEMLKDKDFDFLLGSVHYLGDTVLHSDYTGRKEEVVYEQFFSEVLNSAKKGDFHILGHIDVLKRYVPSNYKKFMAKDHEEMIREILKETIKNDKGIEVNTSGIRQAVGDYLPTLEIVKWYHELGGNIITVGSDAHTAKHVGMHIKEAIDALREMGFKTISTYTKGQRSEVRI